MQKFDTPCIKTGDFAKLCGTNKRTLFHYDEIGLFSPAYTDEKGYRFYSETQCDVFFTITYLKELGMPLKEIKSYISHQSPAAMERLLTEQMTQVEAEMKRLSHIRTVIDTKLSLLHQARQLQDVSGLSPVFPETQEEDELLILSEPLYSDDHDLLFSGLCRHIGDCRREELNSGYPYGAMMPWPSLECGNFDTYAYFFTKTRLPQEQIPPDRTIHKKRAGNYAAVYLRGNYYASEGAYRKPPAPSCTKKRFWTSCRPEKRNISPESPYFLRIHRRSRSLAARQQSSRLHMYRKNPEILHSLTADSSSPGFYFPLSKTSATFFRYSVTESFWGQWRSQLLHPMHSAALPCFRASRS